MKQWDSNIWAKSIAVILCLGMYFLTIPHDVSAKTVSIMGHQFQFRPFVLPEVTNHPPFHYIRPVNPSLHNIAGWVSSVGADVAIGDLSQNTLPNDIVYVDTRTNEVVVAPAPGTGHRFAPFALNPAPLYYSSHTMAPTGVQIADLNGDGQPDIIVYYWGRAPVVFMKRSGFAGQPLKASMFVPQNLVSGRYRWYTDAMTIADLSGNGHLDIVVGNYFPNGARILGSSDYSHPQHMQRGMSDATNAGRLEVLQWIGGSGGRHPFVRYRLVPNAIPIADQYGWCLALGSVDLTPNLLPSVYVANDFGPDHLLYNVSTRNHIRFRNVMGAKSWSQPKSYRLGHDSFKGMGVAYGDLTANGRTDIFVSNIGTKFGLLESNFAWMNTGNSQASLKRGIAPFINESDRMNLSHSGWAWGAQIGYFNNSIYPQIVQASGFLRGKAYGWAQLQQLATGNDALLANPQFWPTFQSQYSLNGTGELRFYARDNTNGKYANLSSNLSIHDVVSRAIAVADVLGNGRESFAVANQWAPSKFYLNTGRYRPHFLELRLLLPGSLRSSPQVIKGHPVVPGTVTAFTATARVQLKSGHALVGQVSDTGKRDTNIFFSLGTKTRTNTTYAVQLRWRSQTGALQTGTVHMPAGYYTVVL